MVQIFCFITARKFIHSKGVALERSKFLIWVRTGGGSVVETLRAT